MKKQYSKPTAVMMDYTYDTQVVAESNLAASRGDPMNVKFCTWWSGWIPAGCREKFATNPPCSDPVNIPSSIPGIDEPLSIDSIL